MEDKEFVHAPTLDGFKAKIGASEYIVPPLNFRQIKENQKELESFKFAEIQKYDPKGLDFIAKIILIALKRNYPSLTAEFLQENLDMDTAINLFAKVMNGSGLRQSPAGEAATSNH